MEEYLIGTSGREWGPEWTFSQNGRIEQFLIVILASLTPRVKPGSIRFGIHREVAGHLAMYRSKPIVTGVGRVSTFKDGLCMVDILIGPEVLDLEPDSMRTLLSSLWLEGVEKMAKACLGRFPEGASSVDKMISVVRKAIDQWASTPLSEIDLNTEPKWTEQLGKEVIREQRT